MFGVAITDVDGDGLLDVVTLNSGGSFSVLPDDGTARFPTLEETSLQQFEPTHMVAGDLNGDGKLDFAISNASNSMVSVMLGTGTFAFARADYKAGADPSGLAIADVTGDGVPDIVVTEPTMNAVGVLAATRLP